MYLVIATYMSVAAGVGTLGVLLLVAPLLLLGIASGLALFLPRTSAVLSLLLASPYLYVGIGSLLSLEAPSEALPFLLPAAFVAIISTLVLSRRRPSIWSQVSGPWAKTVVVLAAILPMTLLTYVLVTFFSTVTFH